MIGGLTGVNRDVIPYAMAFGDHAELAGSQSDRPEAARDCRATTIHALRGAFRAIFYGEGGDIKSRATAMKAQLPDVTEVGEVVEFILAPAKQKLCTARRRGGRRMTILGIIAGGGELPRAVAQSARADGRTVFVVALRGMCGDWAEEFSHEWVSLGEPGRALKALAGAGAKDVLLAGRVERPKFSELKLDAKGVMVLPRVIAAARTGRRRAAAHAGRAFRRRGISCRQRGAKPHPDWLRTKARLAAFFRTTITKPISRARFPSSARWARWMSARRRRYAKDWRWRWKPPRAPTR